MHGKCTEVHLNEKEVNIHKHVVYWFSVLSSISTPRITGSGQLLISKYFLVSGFVT